MSFPADLRKATGSAACRLATAALLGGVASVNAAVEFPAGAAPASEVRVGVRAADGEPRASRPDASVASARKSDRREPTLRCFQEGRLVYEGSGLTPAARTATPLDFRSTRSRQVTVQVLDLKSGLCLVESGDAP